VIEVYVVKITQDTVTWKESGFVGAPIRPRIIKLSHLMPTVY